VPICSECAAAISDLFKAEALTLLEQADKAARDPRMRRHEATLRGKAHGLGYAVALLREQARG
jgi:hypothetical protein